MTPRIAVFGLGYVGAVSAACFADRGHEVIGVDVNPSKVDMINAGRTPVVEERIGELIAETVASGRLRATTDATEAVRQTDIALVCVGTPSTHAGGLTTAYLEAVADDIGAAIAEAGTRYTVAFRSTMLPGTCDERLIPRLEAASGLKAGADFGVCVNPEFLREGSSVKDFNDPPKTVIGQIDDKSGEVIASLYEGLPGPVHRVPIKVAELAKYADNCFHAVKVTFANEIGAVCGALGLDSHQVMDIFVSDTKLNISPAYLKPGFAFGGSCLPKDLRALTHTARHRDVSIPMLDHVLTSNEHQIDRVFQMVANTGLRRIGLFGLSFKAGTDDLRESPLVELAERLVGRGFELLIHDSQVSLSALHGANRAYVDSRIPHLSKLMVGSPDQAAAHAEVAVLGTGTEEAVAAVERSGASVIVDLVRNAATSRLAEHPGYRGISW
ncbi:MAG: nucleotide sugar dehydrogenase [Actinomycetota bacterium]